MSQQKLCLKIAVRFFCILTLTKKWQFDGCLGPSVTQDQVMEKCQVRRLLDSVLEGYSSTIMACGQTGSGKTYTMCGREDVCYLFLMYFYFFSNKIFKEAQILFVCSTDHLC